MDCGLQRLLKARERDRQGAFRRIHQQAKGIAEPVEYPRAQDRGIDQREQTLLQGQQGARQVAAVHRRNVDRLQRLQRLGVVPVIKVAAIPFQAHHRAQRAARAVDEASGRQVAEVMRGQIREQRQSHVGRRRAMRDRGHGMFLHVVRRQPIVFRADEGFEERPSLAGNRAEKAGLLGRQAGFAASERAAHPPGDRGRGQPQQQDRSSHGQHGGLGHRQTQRRHHRERGSHPHHPVKSAEILAPLAIQVA